MQIYDVHVHVEKGLCGYDLDSCDKNVIYNDFDWYQQNLANLPDCSSQTLIFDYKNKSNLEIIKHLTSHRKLNALKVHSRIQKISASDYSDLAEALSSIPNEIPVIVDGFYYGSEMEFQPNLAEIVYLIRQFPRRRFSVAHCGGHKVLDYFFHLRELKNVYYELSLSLQYLADTSRFLDLKKLIKYTDKSRILFGSDYPFASPKLQLEILESISEELKLSSSEFEQIIYGNAVRLFARIP